MTEALVKLAGIFMVAFGAVFLARVSAMKEVVKFWATKNHLYFGGLFSIVIGILFLVAASNCRVFWLVVLIGIISIIKGVLIFTPFRSRCISLSKQIADGPASKIRFMAAFLVAVGVLVIYAV